MRANLLRSNGLLTAERVAADLAGRLGTEPARRLVAKLGQQTGPATLRQLLDRRPGHNGTPAPAGAYNIGGLADQVVALLDLNRCKGVAYCGIRAAACSSP